MLAKLTIVGNLGNDPELRKVGENAVCNLSVASNRRYTNSAGEKVEETTWFRISVWGKQAEACGKYLSKGRAVLIEGRLVPDNNGNPRIYARKDGTAGASFEVRADNVTFLDSNPSEASRESAVIPFQVEAEQPAELAADIPF